MVWTVPYGHMDCKKYGIELYYPPMAPFRIEQSGRSVWQVTAQEIQDMFRSSLVTALTSAGVLKSRSVGHGSLSYSRQDVAKLVYARYLLEDAKERGKDKDAVDFSVIRGIIPGNIFDRMQAAPWWTELNLRMLQKWHVDLRSMVGPSVREIDRYGRLPKLKDRA